MAHALKFHVYLTLPHIGRDAQDTTESLPDTCRVVPESVPRFEHQNGRIHEKPQETVVKKIFKKIGTKA